MQCYTQLTLPTAVTHSLSLPFLAAAANNLIVAKTSLLQVFALKSVLEEIKVDGTNGLAASRQRGERTQTTKLVLISEYEIPGTITALARIKLLKSRSGGDAVLVASRDAKISLIEWDPEQHTISTISIHYYEREDLQCSPWDLGAGNLPTYLTVDPGNRCAALKFGARHIAILPFHQAGDELVADEDDHHVNGTGSSRHGSIVKITNGDSTTLPLPYAPSFVLSLLALDPVLAHPIHLAFLHGYREPTFGILSSQAAVSSALLHERRDILSYIVYTLDLEQRASTALLSITHLPYDLHKILPLPAPIGGALLLGANEIIHVDQSGKTNGVTVNEFAKRCTTFPLSSQAELGLRLEGCSIEQLGNQSGDMLIILNTGDFALLRFHIDSRSVSGLSVKRISQPSNSQVMYTAASCVCTLGRGRLFIGSEESDSVVVGWTLKSSKHRKRQEFAAGERDQLDNETDADDMEEEEEDDLYSSEQKEEYSQATSNTEEDLDYYVFRIHDLLTNLAPLHDLRISVANNPEGRPGFPLSQTELLVTNGGNRSGALTRISSRINTRSKKRYDLSLVRRVWSTSMKKANAPKNGAATQGKYMTTVITSNVNDGGEDESRAYTLAGGEFQEIQDSDFDPSAGGTVELGTLNDGGRIVQVLKNEIRGYDSDFGLAQIFPLLDDPSPNDPDIVCVSFAEPYIFILREDSGMMILKADESGDLEEFEKSDLLSAGEWASGSLFDDSNDLFCLESDLDDEAEDENVLLFLLNAQGGLQIFRLSDLSKPAYIANGLSFLPPFLSSDFTVRRSTARDIIVEILVAEIGESTFKSPYLILRSASDTLTIYQPYQVPSHDTFRGELRFLKISSPAPANSMATNGQTRLQSLRLLSDVDGYSAVLVTGLSPYIILKPAASQPHIIELCEAGVRSISGFHTDDCSNGFIWSDEEGTVYSANLPLNSRYETGWVVQCLFSGYEVVAFDYHEPMDRYVVGTGEKKSYKLAEDELHPEWSNEAAELLPQLERGKVMLIDPSTWTVTDIVLLDQAEVVTCIKTMLLETSEHSQARRPLVVVGTSLIRGDDLATHGRLYVFDIIEVVPEPDRPETGRKFKLIAKEEVKGAVTAIDEIGTEGFLLVAQGQKCMVRGLKEDGTLLPVAFMDMQCYVTVAKELRATGLCVMGDAIKGVWFVGYTEDPYQLKLFGKSSENIEVVAAEFLPDAKQLYIVAIDADGCLHVLQFEPSNPKSLAGQRLLPLSSFNTGSYPSIMKLLPTDSGAPDGRILIASKNGSLSLLSTVEHSAYRALTALQSYLTSTLSHPLGLNPRLYRSVEADISVGGRAVLDGNILKTWNELGSWKQAEAIDRTGLSAWELRELLSKTCVL